MPHVFLGEGATLAAFDQEENIPHMTTMTRCFIRVRRRVNKPDRDLKGLLGRQEDLRK
jgi:hypothetical protein